MNHRQVSIRFAEKENITAVVEAFTDYFEIDQVYLTCISFSHPFIHFM